MFFLDKLSKAYRKAREKMGRRGGPVKAFRKVFLKKYACPAYKKKGGKSRGPYRDTTRMSVLLVYKNRMEYTCADLRLVLAAYGKIVRVIHSAEGPEHRYAIYYKNETAAAEAMMSLKHYKIALPYVQLLGLVRSKVDPQVHFEIIKRLGGVVVENKRFKPM